MTTIKAAAPAKINLTLHVTGQRDDGYHLLDSLVVFADASDQLTATLAPDLQLRVSGPFASGVPDDDRNLVILAARALQAARDVQLGAQLTLEKSLPHGAGIGSGSSDAATALQMLAQLWDVAPLAHDAPEVIALGADVPVCMAAPSPMRMQGIGDVLTRVAPLPPCAFVLVNPREAVPTGSVFAGLTSKQNPPMQDPQGWDDFDGFVAWLCQQRNDLQPPAQSVAPGVVQALARLNAMPQVRWAGMSGSGATCVGLVANMGDARQVARAIQIAEMSWWVAPAALLA